MNGSPDVGQVSLVSAQIASRRVRKRAGRFWNRLADSRYPAIFTGGDAGFGLEGAIEGAEGAEARVEGERQDRHVGLARGGRGRLDLGDGVAVHETVEVPVAQGLVDQTAQAVLGQAELARQGADGEAVL